VSGGLVLVDSSGARPDHALLGVRAEPVDLPARMPWAAVRLPAHTGDVRSVCWSPDGLRLVSTGDDGCLRLWEFGPAGQPGSVRTVWRTGQPAGACVAWSPDGARVALGLNNETIILDARAWVPLARIDTSGLANGVAFAPDARRLAVAASASDLMISSLVVSDLVVSGSAVTSAEPAGGGDECARWEGHTSSINAVRWSADGRALASAGYDGIVIIWDGDGRVRHRLSCDGSAVWDVDVSADGAHVVAVTHSRRPSGFVRRRRPPPAPTRRAAGALGGRPRERVRRQRHPQPEDARVRVGLRPCFP
jgi:WD40 repeat protein